MAERKRLLILSYYFPPCGMGGVQRAAKMAKYLPEFGWDVTVLTVKDISYYSKDHSFLDELSHVDIQRTGSLDPLRLTHLFFGSPGQTSSNMPASGRETSNYGSGLTRIFRVIDRLIFVPDSKILWNIFAYRKACNLLKNSQYDAILSTAPPFSTHLMAMKLARKFRLPWIADFRDGWTNKDFLPPKGGLHKNIHASQEKSVSQNADAILAVSKKIKTHLDSLTNDNLTGNSKTSLIYNGFDSDDFDFHVEKDNCFSLLFMGTVTDWAEPSVMFGAVEKALTIEPELKDFLKIRIVGSVFTNAFHKRIKDHNLRNYLEIVGYMDHKSALQELMKSSLLLFAVTVYNTSGLITGKIFEYLASGKPFLAHTPDGEAKEMIQECCEVKCFHDLKREEISVDFIILQFRAWRANRILPGQSDGSSDRSFEPLYKSNKLKKFSRKFQIQEIASILDSLSNNVK